jgi:hypothetical protein
MSSTDAAARWALWLHAVRPVPDLVGLARAAEDLGAYALLLADEGIDRDKPEMIAFGAHEYSVDHVADIAARAGEVGLHRSAGDDVATS